jgi:pimeloyl-ACP methyl ester carboxylesterase
VPGSALRGPVTAADGTRLHVIERGPGDGDVVLAVHGFASSAELNWLNAGWERPLTDAGYRLVAFDLRGHGGSDRPGDATSYRLATLADDALRVLDAVGADRAHWLGYSLGSRIGFEVARQAPERLRTLNLGGTSAADPPVERLTAMLADLGIDDPALRAFATGVSADAPPMPDAPLGIPTLFVAGSDDAVAAGGERLADALGARYVELPGRTHANAVTSRAFKDAVLENLGGA